MKYTTFKEFYPFYLSQHCEPMNKLLHFIGTTLVLFLVVRAIVLLKWPLILLAFVCGYGFAWIGHFFIEKNKPATFQYPVYSLMGDFMMWWEILIFKIKISK
jgi:hypothetical protein